MVVGWTKWTCGILTGTALLAGLPSAGAGVLQNEWMARNAAAGRIDWEPCEEEGDEAERRAQASAVANGLAMPFKGARHLLDRIAVEHARGGIQCGTLRVPLDHSEPGEMISLALTRIKGTAKDNSHLGPLLVNPGGPGAPGTGLAEYVAGSLPPKVARRFDVIGFDPRGVGASRPTMSCTNADRYYKPPVPDNVPRSRTDEMRLKKRARAYAQGCARRHGRLLNHMTTADNARDMEAIRKALGARKISYFGYSYGTYLGGVYASMFPKRVRRLVMDSTVDPEKVWYQANITQNVAFNARHRDFLAWVARNRRTFRIGSSRKQVEFAYYALRNRLRDRPAKGIVGPSELDETFVAGGYADAIWPQLAGALSAYIRKGATKPLVEAYETHGKQTAEDENGYAVYLGTECTDNAWPTGWGRWRTDAITVHGQAPFMAWQNTWYNAPCATWPTPAGRPVPIKGKGLPRVLIIQARHDAATPYGGARSMKRRLPSARLIVEAGGNHGVSLVGNTCVDRRLARYLAHGTARNARCKALPPPDPAERRASRHLDLIGHIRGR